MPPESTTRPSPPAFRRKGLIVSALIAAAAAALAFTYSRPATLASEAAPAQIPLPDKTHSLPQELDAPNAPKAEPEPIPVAVPGLQENLYSWKSGDVFRFDYSKTITIKQLDEDGKPAERVTEVNGFLIFEIKSVSPSGAAARLRIDSPHISIPEVTLYSSQFDDPEVQAGKGRAVARAMEGVLKNASWNVVLGSTGLIYIESRAPANLREWFKDVENSANWRRKSLEILPRLIEQDLGLKAPSHDRDILLYLGSAAQPGLAPADALRPRRELISSAPDSEDETKLAVSFKRVKPAEKEPYLIPGLVRDEKISAELSNVSATSGKAVFDTQLGMIDTLNEDYTMDLAYKYGPHLKLEQSVRVQYRVRRLAPPINKP